MKERLNCRFRPTAWFPYTVRLFLRIVVIQNLHWTLYCGRLSKYFVGHVSVSDNSCGIKFLKNSKSHAYSKWFPNRLRIRRLLTSKHMQLFRVFPLYSRWNSRAVLKFCFLRLVRVTWGSLKYLEPSFKRIPINHMYVCKIGGCPGQENLIDVFWVAVVDF
jgi:hypothetical protein